MNAVRSLMVTHLVQIQDRALRNDAPIAMHLVVSLHGFSLFGSVNKAQIFASNATLLLQFGLMFT